MALVKCKECGNKISKAAKTCPSCGSPQRRTSPVALLFAIVAGIFVVQMIATGGSGGSSAPASAPQQAVAAPKPQISPEKRRANEMELQGLEVCNESIRKNAAFPSTVSSTLFGTTAKYSAASGYTIVNIDFTAKNALGSELPYRGFCQVADDGKLLTFNVSAR